MMAKAKNYHLNEFQNSELAIRIDCLEGDNIVNPQQSRLELKVRELESKLELEQTTR